MNWYKCECSPKVRKLLIDYIKTIGLEIYPDQIYHNKNNIAYAKVHDDDKNLMFTGYAVQSPINDKAVLLTIPQFIQLINEVKNGHTNRIL